jgi:hypothetical protein
VVCFSISRLGMQFLLRQTLTAFLNFKKRKITPRPRN